mmetsp:Transcript_3916/g.8851  ORF Transcript_3916/g.8851 Transcript_3916/m.8851 type:complete len:494 (+) Transcript_3916:114-1595(+)|eukprot:CAMPEP_0116852320 /NCGR_PEP_ID=MMETSP0418-20121206/17223_1 /TAXON_ID=1158023 /ORGANISM="Astrosyne radiata, Strain 13vi08-1A" /LENGTH=493 /DNA_ID=CAMNT_0004484461 /DNA_START=95 /DNA_END=1576 /DNA_ORIENTATION=-
MKNKTDDMMDVDPTVQLVVRSRQNVIGRDAVDTKTTEVCATLQACDLANEDDDDESRAPVDILVSLDVSGSMAGSKLELCKETLQMLLRQLKKDDRFGLVTFSTVAHLHLPLRRLDKKHLRDALDSIRALRASGATNLSGGIVTAAEELTRQMGNDNDDQHRVRSVFLLTDGFANQGVTDANTLSGIVENLFSQHPVVGDRTPRKSPMTMHCFGYGEHHDDTLLRRLSNSTPGGTYYYVQNDSNVTSAFGDALGGILSVVAQNVTLHFQVPDEAKHLGVVLEHVYHDKATDCGDGRFQVQLHDLYAEESRDVVCRIRLANRFPDDGMDDNPSIPHLAVQLTYVDTVRKCLAKEDAICVIDRPKGKTLSAVEEHVAVQALRVEAVREMARAQELSRAGQMEEARARMQRVSLQTRSAAPNVQQHPLVQQLQGDLDEVQEGMRSVATFRAGGSKALNSTVQSHEMQRFAASGTGRACVYRSKKKTAMARKFHTMK